MFKELFKEMPWGMIAAILLVQLVILAGVVAGATWIVAKIWSAVN